ncbi:MAG TPA: hypothetical protein VJT67_03390 [Longimicrobiaceae bacterium]|nr:hypothetical protein [Longimicrobiaceae bacterium]
MGFLSRLFGGDSAARQLAAAVQHAQAGRHGESAAAWLRALEQKPLLVPKPAQLAALEPVLPRIARAALDGLSVATKRWTLERRGSFDGEERWRLEQDRHWPMAELEPTLRYLALLIAHTSAAPGRLRIDCDRPNDDSEAYNPVIQMGEAIITWDESRRITDVRVED